jgi:hypothetical protein
VGRRREKKYQEQEERMMLNVELLKLLEDELEG